MGLRNVLLSYLRKIQTDNATLCEAQWTGMTNCHHRASLVNKSGAKNRRDNERGKDLRPDREALIRNASLSNSPGRAEKTAFRMLILSPASGAGKVKGIVSSY